MNKEEALAKLCQYSTCNYKEQIWAPEAKELLEYWTGVEKQIKQLQQESNQLKDRIEKATAILKENFVEEYVRSCDTADGVGYYEVDKYHWTYEAYQILKGEENEQ